MPRGKPPGGHRGPHNDGPIPGEPMHGPGPGYRPRHVPPPPPPDPFLPPPPPHPPFPPHRRRRIW